MKIILIITIIIVSIFVLVFLIGIIIGIVSKAAQGHKKNRRAHAIIILSQLSEELRYKMIDILLAHKKNDVTKINSIVDTIGLDILNQLLKLIGPENRPKEFSSGKFGDKLAWTVAEKLLQDQDYTINSSKIVAGIIHHDLDIVLMEMNKK